MALQKVHREGVLLWVCRQKWFSEGFSQSEAGFVMWVWQSDISPEVLFVIKTASQVTLTQLRNESVTSRSRPFAHRFNYARDMSHGTNMYPASVKAV